MADAQKWEHFVTGYIMGHTKDGKLGWVEFVTTRDSQVSISDSLARFGQDGWELVSTLYMPHGPDGSEIMCFFRKPA